MKPKTYHDCYAYDETWYDQESVPFVLYFQSHNYVVLTIWIMTHEEVEKLFTIFEILTIKRVLQLIMLMH